MKQSKVYLATLNKIASKDILPRRFFRPAYRLIEIEHGRLGIYREGGGYIVDPSDTLFFSDEVLKIYEQI
jgi:hypothetical protein